jgi:hypothetical protein
VNIMRRLEVSNDHKSKDKIDLAWNTMIDKLK